MINDRINRIKGHMGLNICKKIIWIVEFNPKVEKWLQN